MGTCHYCRGPLPEGSRADRLYCKDAHRINAYRARREEALELFREGSRLRAAGVTDRARLDAIDARIVFLLGEV